MSATLGNDRCPEWVTCRAPTPDGPSRHDSGQPPHASPRRRPRAPSAALLLPLISAHSACWPTTRPQLPSSHPGGDDARNRATRQRQARSEEHTSELQSLMRISYAVFSLKKKNI